MTTPSRHDTDAALTHDVSRLVRQAVLDAVLNLDSDKRADWPALTVERARVARAPAALAAALPGADAAARREMQAVYGRCLAHYRHVLRAEQADAGIDDVGAAVAHFVAANMQALRGIEIAPPTLLRLERQLAGIVRQSAAWTGASAREQQLYFEKMAILAVLIDVSSKQAAHEGAAAVANVKRAARGYLSEWLGLDPDALTIGDDGLVARTAC